MAGAVKRTRTPSPSPLVQFSASSRSPSSRPRSRNSRSGSPRPSGELKCTLNGAECQKRIEKVKELWRVQKENDDLRFEFNASVKREVEGQLRNYDAYVKQPLESRNEQLDKDLKQTHKDLAQMRKLAHSLEHTNLDLLGDKVKLTGEVATLRKAMTKASVAEAAVARRERHALIDHKKTASSLMAEASLMREGIVRAEKRVANAESTTEAATAGEAIAWRDAEVANSERDELREDLLEVEKVADETKWSLLLAEKREARAKSKLALLEERFKVVDVAARAERSSEDWAALNRWGRYKAHQREQARFDSILAGHAFPPNDIAAVLSKRGLLDNIFDSPNGADIYFERLKEIIDHIATAEYGMPLAMYMHYQLKIPVPTLLCIDQAGSKKYSSSANRYDAKVLYSHPYRSGQFIKVPRIVPAVGKVIAATDTINKSLDIEVGENGAVSYRPVKSAFESMVKNGVGKHGMPELSAFADGAIEVPLVFQWDATGFKKQQLTTAAVRNPHSPHSAELLEVWAVGNVSDDKGGSTKLMGKQNIDTINDWIRGETCVDCNIGGVPTLLKPKPYFTLDLACLRHTEHIANSGFCGCDRDYSLRTTPPKPTSMVALRALLSKCKAHTARERFILSHMPLPGNDVPEPCTARGCTFGHGNVEKVRAEWEALLAEEKKLAAVLTKTGKQAFSKWRMAHAKMHFNIQPGEYGAPFFHYDLDDFLLDLLHLAELGIPKTPWKHGILNNCSDDSRAAISDYLTEIKHPLDTRRKDDGKSRVDKWFSGEKFASFCRGDKGSPGGPVAIAKCVKIIADDMQLRGVTAGGGSATEIEPVQAAIALPSAPPKLTGKAAKAAKSAAARAVAPAVAVATLAASGDTGALQASRAKLVHVPSEMEKAADPAHVKIIRDVYGSRAQTILNALLAFDAFFAWYYPLKKHTLELFDTDTAKVEQRALDNCQRAIDMHESFERLTLAGKLGHKSFLPHGAIFKLTKDILKVGDSSRFSVSALELQNAETKRTGEQGGARNIELRQSGFKRVPSSQEETKVVPTIGYGTTMSLSILRKLLGKKLLQLGDGLLRMPLMRRAERLFGAFGPGRSKQKSEGKHELLALRHNDPSGDTCVAAFVRSMAAVVGDLDPD